jgi:hypothetical protein
MCQLDNIPPDDNGTQVVGLKHEFQRFAVFNGDVGADVWVSHRRRPQPALRMKKPAQPGQEPARTEKRLLAPGADGSGAEPRQHIGEYSLGGWGWQSNATFPIAAHP